MKSPAAFAGNYVDCKFIKTRSVCQIHVEIPIEKAAEFIKTFGAPLPSEEIPVALALLNVEAVKEPESYAQQVGALCNAPIFWVYLTQQAGDLIDDETAAANYVREFCEVPSRRNIKRGTHAGNRWEFLASGYYGWKAAEKAGAA